MSRHIKPQHRHEINIDVVGGHPFFSLLLSISACEEQQLGEQKAPAGAGTLRAPAPGKARVSGSATFCRSHRYIFVSASWCGGADTSKRRGRDITYSHSG